jgi:hypothetical protein
LSTIYTTIISTDKDAYMSTNTTTLYTAFFSAYLTAKFCPIR